jgi:hypothetical protein
MTPRAVFAVACLLLAAAYGCEGPQPAATARTGEQLAAIQTTQVEASRDDTFRAAAAVMIDRGMMITMSDFSAGLIRAGQWGYSGGIGRASLVTGPGLVVWVHSDEPSRTTMRVSFDQGTSQEGVNRFVEQVQNRLLAAAEPRGPAP